MPIAYFDAISGAAGDMILGALIDAGLDIDLVRSEISKLDLEGVEIRVDRVMKQHISAAQFEVTIRGTDEHGHPDHHHGHERALKDSRALISGSSLSSSIRDRALEIFERLGRAEARIHGVPLDEVHFHEVGAIDSIVDIVGSAAAFDLLGLEAVYSSPLPTGSGVVHTRHGVFPVPAPATLEIMAEARVPSRPSRIQAEQVTPTGAAILATVATFEQPAMRVERTGYGAGHSDLEIPNVLRVWIGEATEGSAERLIVLETNIDDMSPELSSHILDRCMSEGALDALLVPVVMKKGRPGVKLEVLCRPADRERLSGLILRETTTLGVRWHEVERLTAEREVRSVQTEFGLVAVKVRLVAGDQTGAFPEYDDCLRVARERNVPLLDVYNAALRAAGNDRQSR